MCLAVSTVPACDRRTDRWTDILRQHSPRYAWHRAVKTRKPSRPNVVENDVSATSPTLTSPFCDLELWPPDSRSWSFHRRLYCMAICSKIDSFFSNIVFTSFVTDRRTNKTFTETGRKRYASGQPRLAEQKNFNKKLISRWDRRTLLANSNYTLITPSL